MISDGLGVRDRGSFKQKEIGMRGWFALATVILFCGCDSRLDLHPVTGTVKFKDGTVPTGEMATITFQPVNLMEGKAASSNIESDGSYELWTLEQGDGGALAGDYNVTLNVIEGYPQPVHQVAREYTDPSTTPLKETVEPGKNQFDFEVEKPKKKRR